MIARRHFAAIAGTALVRAAEPLTAEMVVRRIQGAADSNGPDGFKAGDPATVVRGVATTAMATMDVLKRAVAAKANLVLTYEPTFYSRAESARADDPVYRAKKEFIEKNGMVVYRLRPKDMVTGLATALGWGLRRDEALCEISAASAEATVAHIRAKLALRGGLRVVGDRKAMVRRVLLMPGSMGPAAMWARYGDVDMIVAGEVREWENTHYAADMFAAGEKRALVTIGRVVSEEPGMRACAEWVRGVVRDVPVRFIPVGDPYWRPVR